MFINSDFCCILTRIFDFILMESCQHKTMGQRLSEEGLPESAPYEPRLARRKHASAHPELEIRWQ